MRSLEFVFENADPDHDAFGIYYVYPYPGLYTYV